MAFLGVIRALQSNINKCYSPQPAAPSPLLTEDLPGSWPGRYMRMDTGTAPNNTVCTVPQSVQYHKLPPPSVLRPATSQAKLQGVRGRKSMYETFFVIIRGVFTSPPGPEAETSFHFCWRVKSSLNLFELNLPPHPMKLIDGLLVEVV